jgi:hypothetical protein
MLDARTFDTALIKLSSIITGNPWTCNIIRPKIRFQEDPSFLASSTSTDDCVCQSTALCVHSITACIYEISVAEASINEIAS